jgi:lipopolysaccharide transport system permease protein
METSEQNTPTMVIRPSSRWRILPVVELWRYKELFYFLVWRDIKVRYKQTVFGASWAVFKPVMTMILFSIIFGRLADLPSDGVPYPVFTFTALLPWQLFSLALNTSSESLVNSRGMLTKVYFPRVIMPTASLLAGLVDFGIAFVVLLVLMAWFGIIPTLAIVTLPLFLIFAIATALSVGLWLSVLNVRFRDVKQLIPFLTQFWLFATPIAYSSSLVPEKWRFVYALNPMTGVVDGFRWALLGTEGGFGPHVAVSAVVVVVLLVGGLAYFHKMEKSFADLV